MGWFLNNNAEKTEKAASIKKRLQTKDMLVICLLGILLLVGIWMFFREEKPSGASGTQVEQNVSALLGQIDGVGEAEVMIYQTEDGVQSVVVVCEGAKDLQVIINVREAVAAALGTQEKAVKVYLKKE